MSDVIDLARFRNERNESDTEMAFTEKLLSGPAPILPFVSANGASEPRPPSRMAQAQILFSDALLAKHMVDSLPEIRATEGIPIFRAMIEAQVKTTVNNKLDEIGKLGYGVDADILSLDPEHPYLSDATASYNLYRNLFHPRNITSLASFKAEFESASQFSNALLHCRNSVSELPRFQLDAFFDENAEDSPESIEIIKNLTGLDRAVFAAANIVGGKVKQVMLGLGNAAGFNYSYSYSNMPFGMITPSGVTYIATTLKQWQVDKVFAAEDLSLISHAMLEFFDRYRKSLERAGQLQHLLATALDAADNRIRQVASESRFDVEDIPITDSHIEIFRNHYSIHPTLGELDYWDYFSEMHGLDRNAASRLVDRVSAESVRRHNQIFVESRFYAIKSALTDSLIRSLNGSGVHIQVPDNSRSNQHLITLVYGLQSLTMGIKPIDDDLQQDRVKIQVGYYTDGHFSPYSLSEEIVERFDAFGEHDAWPLIATCHNWINEQHVGLDFKAIYDFVPSYKLPDEDRYKHTKRAREWMKEAIELGVLPKDLKYTIAEVYGGYQVKISALPEGMLMLSPKYHHMVNDELKHDYESRQDYMRRNSKFTAAYSNLERAISLVLDGVHRSMNEENELIYRDGKYYDCDVRVTTVDKLNELHNSITLDAIEHVLSGPRKWEHYDNFSLQPNQFNNRPPISNSIPFIERTLSGRNSTVDIELALTIDKTYRSMAETGDIRVLPSLNALTPVVAINDLLSQHLPKGEAGNGVCEILTNTRNMLLHFSDQHERQLAFHKIIANTKGNSVFSLDDSASLSQQAAQCGWLTVMTDANADKSYSWVVDQSGNSRSKFSGVCYSKTMKLISHAVNSTPMLSESAQVLAIIDVHPHLVMDSQINPDPSVYFGRMIYDESLHLLAAGRKFHTIPALTNHKVTQHYSEQLNNEIEFSSLRSMADYRYAFDDKPVELIIATALKKQAFINMIKTELTSGNITKNQHSVIKAFLQRDDFIVQDPIIYKSNCGTLFINDKYAIQKSGNVNSAGDYDTAKELLCDHKTFTKAFQAIKEIQISEKQISSIVQHRGKDNRVDCIMVLPNDLLDGAVVTRGFNSWDMHFPDGIKHQISGEQAQRLLTLLNSHGQTYPYYHLNNELTNQIISDVENELLIKAEMQKTGVSLTVV